MKYPYTRGLDRNQRIKFDWYSKKYKRDLKEFRKTDELYYWQFFLSSLVVPPLVYIWFFNLWSVPPVALCLILGYMVWQIVWESFKKEEDFLENYCFTEPHLRPRLLPYLRWFSWIPHWCMIIFSSFVIFSFFAWVVAIFLPVVVIG